MEQLGIIIPINHTTLEIILPEESLQRIEDANNDLEEQFKPMIIEKIKTLYDHKMLKDIVNDLEEKNNVIINKMLKEEEQFKLMVIEEKINTTPVSEQQIVHTTCEQQIAQLKNKLDNQEELIGIIMNKLTKQQPSIGDMFGNLF